MAEFPQDEFSVQEEVPPFPIGDPFGAANYFVQEGDFGKLLNNIYTALQLGYMLRGGRSLPSLDRLSRIGESFGGGVFLGGGLAELLGFPFPEGMPNLGLWGGFDWLLPQQESAFMEE